jgi:hypothetical protein
MWIKQAQAQLFQREQTANLDDTHVVPILQAHKSYVIIVAS